MTKRDHLMEQYEDSLFALLMDGMAEAEGEEALFLNEALKEDPAAEVPEAINLHCENTIRSAFAQKQLRTVGRTTIRWLSRVALVALLSGLLFTAAFALSEDVRVATLNALIQVMDDHTRITFEGDAPEHTGNSPETIPGLEYHYNIALEWIPEGFEMDGGNYKEKGTCDYVSYLSSQDGLIEVSVTPYNKGLTKGVNTEDCTKKDVMVQGHPASLYITNEDMLERRYYQYGMTNIWSQMTIYWIDEELQIIVQVDATNLTEDEMLRLAEGVHWSGGK